MGKKKKTLPKNFKELIEVGDIAALKEVFVQCEWDARGDYNKTTALSFYKIPDELVAHGANVNVENNMKYTPLAKALECCRNSDIIEMAGISQILLDLGTPITLDMMESVKRIGTDFEFYKENFNKEFLYQTEDALLH